MATPALAGWLIAHAAVALATTEEKFNRTFTVSPGGTLIVDVSAKVEAEINVGVCVIRGSLKGNLKARSRVEIYGTARVNGDISTPVLLVEEGAVLTQAMREIKVLCEPANTPDSIDFDVTNLGAGESIHVSDLKVGEGIEIHEAPDTVVASIVTVKEVELEPQIAEAGEPAVVGEEPAPTEGGEE